MRVTNEQRTIILVAVFAGLSLAIGLGIISPTVRYINRINNDAYHLRQNLENRQARVKNLRRSLTEADDIKMQVAGYDERLFRTGDELKLITFLENLAEEAQVEQKINNANLDKVPGGQVAIDVTVVGAYQNVLGYLAKLESGQYFINTLSLRFAPAGKNNLYTLHLKLALYVSR